MDWSIETERSTIQSMPLKRQKGDLIPPYAYAAIRNLLAILWYWLSQQYNTHYFIAWTSIKILNFEFWRVRFCFSRRCATYEFQFVCILLVDHVIVMQRKAGLLQSIKRPYLLIPVHGGDMKYCMYPSSTSEGIPHILVDAAIMILYLEVATITLKCCTSYSITKQNKATKPHHKLVQLVVDMDGHKTITSK